MQALALALASINLAFLIVSITLTVRTKRRLRAMHERDKRATHALYEASVERGKVIVLHPVPSRNGSLPPHERVAGS